MWNYLQVRGFIGLKAFILFNGIKNPTRFDEIFEELFFH